MSGTEEPNPASICRYQCITFRSIAPGTNLSKLLIFRIVICVWMSRCRLRLASPAMANGPMIRKFKLIRPFHKTVESQSPNSIFISPVPDEMERDEGYSMIELGTINYIVRSHQFRDQLFGNKICIGAREQNVNVEKRCRFRRLLLRDFHRFREQINHLHVFHFHSTMYARTYRRQTDRQGAGEWASERENKLQQNGSILIAANKIGGRFYWSFRK